MLPAVGCGVGAPAYDRGTSEIEGAAVPGQEQQRPSRRDKDEVEHEVEPLPRSGAGSEEATASSATDDVDALLDEIDDVLESNAEQFVRQYTQKGGQ